MMMRDLFRGEFVRLTAEEPEFRSKQEGLWQRDSEFHRLADSEPATLFSQKKIQSWAEEKVDSGFKPERYFFSIRALDDDMLIGFLSLWYDPIHREVWVGVGIGNREYWGKGCGTDTMKLCAQYAFTELNAARVSLGLLEYNPRALRAYEKAGFKLEGRTRKDIFREGERTDSLWMGILRDEWFAMHEKERR
jgi:RimJ/RimL family protein N-acetyltransferase